MKDAYSYYRELAASQREGVDFRIVSREGTSGIAVIAIHGGGIEPATDLLADAIAGDSHGYYAFVGLKPSGNRRLHLAGTRFDEPRGVACVTNARVAVSIHGSNDDSPRVGIGGKDGALKERLAISLFECGISTEILAGGSMGGMHPENICNRCQSGAGIQIEVPRRIRRRMFVNFPAVSKEGETAFFQDFVKGVRSVLGG